MFPLLASETEAVDFDKKKRYLTHAIAREPKNRYPAVWCFQPETPKLPLGGVRWGDVLGQCLRKNHHEPIGTELTTLFDWLWKTRGERSLDCKLLEGRRCGSLVAQYILSAALRLAYW